MVEWARIPLIREILCFAFKNYLVKSFYQGGFELRRADGYRIGMEKEF
tara:strand:- start:4107 stop:4250 length:144 start_codon:yes stop_codon:yes gene_type:complete